MSRMGPELSFLETLGDVVPAEFLSDPVELSHTSKSERLRDRRNSAQGGQDAG